MNYQDNENLSVADQKLCQMCGSLKRIDAPKDFDFRLKARIANHKPQSAKSPVFAFLRYAVPLGLAVALLGAVVTNNFYSVDNAAVPQIAGNFTEKPRLDDNPPIENETSLEVASRNNGPNADFENETAKNSNLTSQFSTKDRNELGKFFETPKRNLPTENKGDSRDSASTEPRVIKPQGFIPNKLVETANNFTNLTSFSVKNILSDLGIKANFLGNGWKVQSVGQNTTAERSGVKPNDIIETLDSIKLSTETIRASSINGKNITVIRDGKKIEIELK